MKVLIVEDHPDIVEILEICLVIRWPGTDVLAVDNGLAVARTVRCQNPDLVLLDLGLPGMDGLDALNNLRTFSSVPVIILTARDDQTARVKGLESGADDYIVKPFSHTEFLARVNAVMRRSDSHVNSEVVVAEKFNIDFDSETVSIDGQIVRLTPTEWNLLSFLARNEGRVISHNVIAVNAWGTEYIDEAAIKMCIHRLRMKLGDDPKSPSLIQSHRGRGYQLTLQGS